mgnify:CR=1 FL=1
MHWSGSTENSDAFDNLLADSALGVVSGANFVGVRWVMRLATRRAGRREVGRGDRDDFEAGRERRAGRDPVRGVALERAVARRDLAPCGDFAVRVLVTFRDVGRDRAMVPMAS